MTIALDWRFEALRIFSEAHLQGLQDCHADLEKYSNEAIVAWKQACEGAPDDTPLVPTNSPSNGTELKTFWAEGKHWAFWGSMHSWRTT